VEKDLPTPTNSMRLRAGTAEGAKRRYGAAGCEALDASMSRAIIHKSMRLTSVSVAVVLALAAAHMMAGFAVYGSGERVVKLLQVGSLSLSTASPELVENAVQQSWSRAVEPSEESLEDEGEAMLAEMRATQKLKQQVAAVKGVEEKFSKPQPHESLVQLLRPPPSGQQPTMLFEIVGDGGSAALGPGSSTAGEIVGDGISKALGVGVPGFRHFIHIHIHIHIHTYIYTHTHA